MDVERALAQIHEIHNHLDRTETYRGLRSATTALSAASAVAGAFLQPLFAPEGGLPFIIFWSSIGVLNVICGGGAAAWRYWRIEDPVTRRTTERVAGQFIPALAAGAVVTLSAALTNAPPPALLPGLWSMLFALGIFAARPWLPKGVGWVALAFLGAGAILLARRDLSLSPWAMGGVFGSGQFLAAAILYWNQERKRNGILR